MSQEAPRAAESPSRPDAQAPPPDGARSAPTATTAVPEPPAVEIVHPVTFEVLDLAGADDGVLAAWRSDVLELRRGLDSLGEDLDREMGARLDFEGTRSARFGDFDVSVDAPTKVEYDIPRLGVALEALVQDGRISRGAADRAAPRKTVQTAVQVELNRLLKHADPEVREAIARTRSEIERERRRVSVRRARP